MGVGPTRSEATVEPFGGPVFEPLISRGGSEPGSFAEKDPFRGIPLSRSLLQEIEKEEKRKRIRNRTSRRTFFWRGYFGEGEPSPAFPARSAARPAAELMRRGEWLAGRPLRVREPFEERSTGALSSRRERGFSCCPRMGRELGGQRGRCSCSPATAITAGPLSVALTDAPGWRCNF